MVNNFLSMEFKFFRWAVLPLYQLAEFFNVDWIQYLLDCSRCKFYKRVSQKTRIINLNLSKAIKSMNASSIILKRTDSGNADFQNLVALLDDELRVRDGEEHAFYAQFNKVNIRNAVVCYAKDKPIGCGAFREYNKEKVEIKRMYVLPEIFSWRITCLLI